MLSGNDAAFQFWNTSQKQCVSVRNSVVSAWGISFLTYAAAARITQRLDRTLDLWCRRERPLTSNHCSTRVQLTRKRGNYVGEFPQLKSYCGKIRRKYRQELLQWTMRFTRRGHIRPICVYLIGGALGSNLGFHSSDSNSANSKKKSELFQVAQIS